MQCPTCGAGVDADDYWCEACATRLVPEQDATPESEPEPVLVPAPPKPKPARYVPPLPPAAPPIPVVQQAPPAPPPTAMSVFSRNLGISRWWLLIVPLLIVVALVVSMRAGNDEPVTAPKGHFELYTAPSGAFAVHIPFERIVPVHTGVIITKTLAAEGDAATLYAGTDEYRVTEVEVPGAARPRGIDHCRSIASDVRASEGIVDGHAATVCRWEGPYTFHTEAFVLRGNRVFLIEHVSTSDDLAGFEDLISAFQFFD